MLPKCKSGALMKHWQLAAYIYTYSLAALCRVAIIDTF